MVEQCRKSFEIVLKKVKDTSKFNDDFIKNEESDEVYFLEVDNQYLKKLQECHNDLLFLQEGMKIQKVEKVVPNLLHKIKCAIHIGNLMKALNHELILKKFIEWLNLIQKPGSSHILIWIIS